jgi:dienelactone hydrolase
MTKGLSEFAHAQVAGLTYYRSALSGPAILLMHELPGLTPACIDLGTRLHQHGFTVYMPLLFGEEGEHRTMRNLIRLCVHREFRLFALGKSSPITEKLRVLARKAAVEVPGRGIGVIGMCLTGGFVLSMLAEPSAVAGVVCQPAIPMPAWGERCAALSVHPDELAAVKARPVVRVLGLRFEKDIISPRERMDTLQALLGDRFERVEMPSDSVFRHATLTDHYRDDEHQKYFKRVVDFFVDRLAPKVVDEP